VSWWLLYASLGSKSLARTRAGEGTCLHRPAANSAGVDYFAAACLAVCPAALMGAIRCWYGVPAHIT